MLSATRWEGCYTQDWKGAIVADALPSKEQLRMVEGEASNAFEHPAKVARGLARRIYLHLRDTYGLQPASTILDPFAGVGCFGLDALLLGYHYLGVELEPKWHALSLANATYWRHRFGPQPGSVTFLQGDSQQLRAVLGEAQVHGLVSSPPYSGNEKSDYHIKDSNGLDRDERRDKRQGKGSFRGSESYGSSAGQLGAMPPGALVSSPPFVSTLGGDDSAKMLALHQTINKERKSQGGNIGASLGQSYGSSAGQLGAMPPGALVSSPPYEHMAIGACEGNIGGTLGGRKASALTTVSGNIKAVGYSKSSLNFGNTTGRTFWDASLAILRECYAVLAPGALTAWVVKDFIRKHRFAGFPGDWQRACEQAGFVLVERIEASLSQDHGTQTDLFQASATVKTKRVSPFRLWHERDHPELAIEAEIVLILRKP
jgi:hypothetical protein